jgi:hypothetical protein
MTEPHTQAPYPEHPAASAQAAILTAFTNGITVGAEPVTINDLSHLVYLRELNRIGLFGQTDGGHR